ncbi:MAG TPA: serine hydrolase [Patescibacteria group bacterium]|nr:serine hydrolase [Patescibacteria group bacterium]
MDSYINPRLRRKSRRRRIVFLFTLLAAAIVGTFFYHEYNKNFGETRETSTIITPVEIVSKMIAPVSIIDASEKSSSMSAVVRSAMEGTHGTYGIVIKNLKTGELYYNNQHKSFDTGSLYKLWVMATVYKQIEAGVLTKDQVLSQSIPNLNHEFGISDDVAEQTEGTITSSIGDALTKMITVSDNYSALLLTEKVRLSNVASFLQTNGFAESAVGTGGIAPTTTASDIELFLEKLYKGELGNAQSTAEMIDLLKNQRLNGKLPKYLPDDVVMAHKTGELDDFTHDAGIVYMQNGDYIIVVLSRSDDPDLAAERIADVSKNVYDYFTGVPQ